MESYPVRSLLASFVLNIVFVRVDRVAPCSEGLLLPLNTLQLAYPFHAWRTLGSFPCRVYMNIHVCLLTHICACICWVESRTWNCWVTERVRGLSGRNPAVSASVSHSTWLVLSGQRSCSSTRGPGEPPVSHGGCTVCPPVSHVSASVLLQVLAHMMWRLPFRCSHPGDCGLICISPEMSTAPVFSTLSESSGLGSSLYLYSGLLRLVRRH